MLTLYYTLRSPFARKPRILLAELGLEHHAEELPIGTLDGRLFPAEFEEANPTLRVPALKDGELLIYESNVILEYLLRTYPIGGAPSADPPLATAMTRPEREWEDRMVLTTIETFLDSAVNLAVLTRFGVEPDKVPYLRREQARCQSCLDWLEGQATPEGFAPGVFSIADLNLVCALGWTEQRQVLPWRGRPSLEAILGRYAERPSVAQNPLVYPS